MLWCLLGLFVGNREHTFKESKFCPWKRMTLHGRQFGFYFASPKFSTGSLGVAGEVFTFVSPITSVKVSAGGGECSMD